jgi:hypothetical protein
MSVWGEQLDAAKTGEQFGAVLGKLFAALEAEDDTEDGDDL